MQINGSTLLILIGGLALYIFLGPALCERLHGLVESFVLAELVSKLFRKN